MNEIHQLCHNPETEVWLHINSTWKQLVFYIKLYHLLFSIAHDFSIIFLKRSAEWRLLVVNACSLLWRRSLYVGDWKQVSQHWFYKGGYKLPAVVNYEETHVRKEKSWEILGLLTHLYKYWVTQVEKGIRTPGDQIFQNEGLARKGVIAQRQRNGDSCICHAVKLFISFTLRNWVRLMSFLNV